VKPSFVLTSLFSLVLVLVLVAVVGCGAGSRPADDDGSGDDDAPQTCTAGQNVCDGADVRACNADGSVGAVIDTCDATQTCSNGSCISGGNCGAQGVELIYVVDQNDNFYSFNPANDANTFTLVGVLNCPNPGISLQDGSSSATPFSMSVDREGTAWVLYSSGKLFKVSTADASCSESTWSVGSSGFELFGMGFVSDTVGSDSEHLWISGGSAAAMENMDGNSSLGDIDTSTMTVQSMGPLQSNGEYSPELTGTSAATLYGYFPGSNTYIAELNKTSPATVGVTWTMPDVGVDFEHAISAWAFAQWGGRFYVFVTVTDVLFMTSESKVVRLDPNDLPGQVILPDTGKAIVGAGVSTCAPITID
jgi:hypothetical protein